jgi:recombination protein RecT
MTTNLQTRPQKLSPIDNIRTLLQKSKSQIAMALPKHLSADRIIRVAMTSIQRTPKLLECDPKSLIGAIIQSSQLGLEPDGVLGHAYLIPYGNQVQFIPGYKGLIDLARRSGQVVSIGSHVVYSNEKFTLKFGFSETLEHEPLPPSQRGERKGVYAVARLKDGSVHFEWLWSEEVEAVKTQSLKKMKRPSGPWIDNEDEMWRKTSIRRLAKYLPLSVEFAKAAAVDELADAGVSTAELFEDLDAVPVTTQEPAGKSIDEAFSQMQQPAPEIAEETTVKQPETENKSEKTSSEDQLFAILDLIDGYKIGPGALTAYVVRALRQNKPKDLWTADEAAKVLEEIRKTKGENQ